MKVLICNNDDVVSIADDNVEFDIDLIKSIYGEDITLTVQHFDMTVEGFRKYGYTVVDGEVILKPIERPDPEPIIPEPTLQEQIESLQQQLLETQQYIIDLEYQKLLENGGM